MKNSRYYSKRDFFRVVYTFHNSEDRRQLSIAKELNYGQSYVGNVLTKYFDNRMNLGVLASESKSRTIFVNECLKNENVLFS